MKVGLHFDPLELYAAWEYVPEAPGLPYRRSYERGALSRVEGGLWYALFIETSE
jgi:hypothetical protein